MNSIILISGVPGAGKSTTTTALCDVLQPSAEIHTDDIRHWVHPYELPWVEPEGGRQLRVAVESACRTADAYLEAGYNVVLDDVLTPDKHTEYSNRLRIKYSGLSVLLRPPVEVALTRNNARAKPVLIDRIRELHDIFDPGQFDLVIDNTNLSVDEVVKQIVSRLNSATT